MSKSVAPILIVTLLLLVVSCTKKDEAAPTPASTSTSPSAAAPTKKLAAASAGTDGGGDGSGSSIANARALRAGESVTLKVACNATIYTGPFRFTKDPETINIAGTSKTTSGDQICLGGEWVDATGKFVGAAGFGCVDGKHVGEGKSTFEYSPGNGGNGANPVYLMTKVVDPKPPGCSSVDLTLKIAP